MAAKMKEYMVKAYAILVKNERRDIETLPEDYQMAVAEYLISQEETEDKN